MRLLSRIFALDRPSAPTDYVIVALAVSAALILVVGKIGLFPNWPAASSYFCEDSTG
jgi:hypothetical protein